MLINWRVKHDPDLHEVLDRARQNTEWVSDGVKQRDGRGHLGDQERLVQHESVDRERDGEDENRRHPKRKHRRRIEVEVPELPKILF